MAGKIVEKDITKIYQLVKDQLNYSEELMIERMGGLTNHTYKISLNDGSLYVVRIPGDGTEDMISRKDEKVSTLLACSLGIDENVLYFGDDGSKITKYILNAQTLHKDLMQQDYILKDVAKTLKTLHTCGEDTKIDFDVFSMASNYEKIIFDNHVDMYDDYKDIKSQIMSIKENIDRNYDNQKVPCHNDPLCENWVKGNDKIYLIDWEYAGMNDTMWDIADISIEAELNNQQDELFLIKYFGENLDKSIWKKFYAYKIFVDFLWTLWAKTRVPFDGQSMEDWALERYTRLKNNLEVYNKI